MKNKIILVGGMPASGKTTLGKKISSYFKLPFLDKDTLCDKYTNYVVAKETFPNDRSSDLYTKNLRFLEYEILWTVAFEQASLGLCPVLVAPFSTEFKDSLQMKNLKDKVKENFPDYQLISILLKANPDDVKKDMTLRNRLEDKTKLADWDNYIQDKINFQNLAALNADIVVENRNYLEELFKKLSL